MPDELNEDLLIAEIVTKFLLAGVRRVPAEQVPIERIQVVIDNLTKIVTQNKTQRGCARG